MADEKQNVSEQVTVRPGEANNRLRDALNMSEFNTTPEERDPPTSGEEEHGLTAEVHLSAMLPWQQHAYTLPEKLSLAIYDALGQKPEYSGRYCPLCGETTSHFRPRGKGPDYVKSMQWCCAPCFTPGGAVYEIVKSLMIRQGEIAK